MGKKISKKKLLLLLVDAVLIVLAIYLAFYLRFGYSVNFFDVYTGGTLLSLIIYLLCFYIGELYQVSLKRYSLSDLFKLVMVVTAASIVAVIFYYLLPQWKYGRGIFFLNILFITVFISIWRWLYLKIFHMTISRSNVLIVGAGNTGQAVNKLFTAHQLEFQVLGFIDDDINKVDAQIDMVKVLGTSEQLPDLVQQYRINEIIVAVQQAKNPTLIKNLLDCKFNGINVIDVPTMYSRLSGRLPVFYIRDLWLVYSEGFSHLGSPFLQRVKRVSDLLISLIGLLLASPLCLIATIAIKIDSRGTVLYRQERVGLNGKPFFLLKFRTMTQDAEKDTGPQWAKPNDGRITRIGKILRILRIDEIPQMVNVLRAEMSFIGPRPERPAFVNELTEKIPYYSLRHTVRPGITGWAQVNYPYGSSVEDALEKLQYDLFYIQNLSPLLDLRILLMTIRVILFRRGSR